MRFVRPLALIVALFVIGCAGCGRPAGKSEGARGGNGPDGAGRHDQARAADDTSDGSAGGTAPTRAGHVPQRIISCAPNLTEMLFALGAGERVIGVTRYCQYPPEAKTRPPLGDLYNPNLEAMVAARPDLIVFVPGSKKIAEFFAAHPGPRLLETNACETVAEIQATLLQLGRALGDSAWADSLVAEMNACLQDVVGKAGYYGGGTSPPRYLMVLGHDEGVLEQIYVVGQRTFLSEILRRFGFINVVDEALGRYPILSREAILSLNPDIIIERHLGPATKEEQRQLRRLWEREMPTIKAVRNGHVAIQDDDHVTINGPDLCNTARKLLDLAGTEQGTSDVPVIPYHIGR